MNVIGSPREFRRILVTTDLSELGDRAIPYAYAALPSGGAVFLVHVVLLTEAAGTPNPLYAHYVPGPGPEERAREVARIRELLRGRVPGESEARGIKTEVEVVEAHDIARAICEAATRHDVDAVCTATHGRTGLKKVIFGSVAQEVLRRIHRPILVIPPPRAPREPAG